MSIFVTCSSSLSVDETRAKIAHARQLYQEILKHFWISEVREAESFDREDAARYNFTASSAFLIQWNKEEGSEFIPEIPHIMYEVFGRDKILVFDLNNEVIPPRN
jgi:hypothetical protein